MTKIFLILIIQFFLVTAIVAQQYALELNYQFGTNVPIHPRYPKIQAHSHTGELTLLQHTQAKKIWSILYGQPTVAYSIAYQTLGNADILGNAFYAVPSLDFKVFEWKRLDMRARIGWGAGIITKTYDSFYNKDNIVIGSTLNACVILRALFRYRISNTFHLQLGGGVTHYSNGGFTNPNLGINIPFAQVGIQYSFQKPTVPDSLSTQLIAGLPALNQSFRPFIQIGLGLTEMATSRGPKYPVYNVSIGVSRLMARISKLSLSVEYLYNTAPYAFDRQSGSVVLKHLNYARFSIIATHELLFGHWGLVTSLGVYMNEHKYRRSVLVSKVGFNFYLQNYFKNFKNQLWLGCHVRAYAGEAELVEVTLGYNW
ncbi:acyloxyacyl hydrolase [Aureispira sp. CCB-E]|uniref:acyloxyacyl hydrolase n=1 Tax=Aureispira sp. CCB-E TaxID=3051121 RepID=UPI00286858FF|nr:acyloxyacyl hydrolase [Aureispira sp. CCB-E]WMX14532.1 acyloxyacyl hydrolase [Aureispira sp. CCB-E]